jgi:ribose 1,5-bisphosphokinase
MSGVFVAIVGPSGAGKDTIMRHAEAALAGRDGVRFVRRFVTRAAGTFEDHDSLDERAFAEGAAGGRFALSWRAHGHGYAVPLSALEAVSAGAVAVCNLSRYALADADRVFGRVVAVAVTAPPEVIAARLAARGRDSAAAIAARLGREAGLADFRPRHRIVNDGSVAAAGAALVAIIEELRAQCPAAAAGRASNRSAVQE